MFLVRCVWQPVLLQLGAGDTTSVLEKPFVQSSPLVSLGPRIVCPNGISLRIHLQIGLRVDCHFDALVAGRNEGCVRVGGAGDRYHWVALAGKCTWHIREWAMFTAETGVVRAWQRAALL